jgi:hypothetical protein
MEDAVEQLDNLARSVGDALRAKSCGGGSARRAVATARGSWSSGSRDPPAGGSRLAARPTGRPGFCGPRHSRDKVYVTALAKCVPRSDGAVRGPLPQELANCYPYLSKELTITTPHYVLTVGEETTRFLLGKLFKNRPYEPGDSLELRLFDNPSFKVVPVATPDELRRRDPKARKEYTERLRTLGQVMGL